MPKETQSAERGDTQLPCGNLTKLDYNEYIKSDAWRLKRSERLAIGNHKCAYCCTRKRIQVHHLTYERIGNELMEDLVPLCETHHAKIERIIKSGKMKRTGHPLLLLTETMRLLCKDGSHKVKITRRERRAMRELKNIQRRESRKPREGIGFSPPTKKWATATESERQSAVAERIQSLSALDE